MNIYQKVEIQKNKPKLKHESIFNKINVNENSAIDNYIIAKVSARDRFILRPQQYELFISSAVDDIENNLDDLLKDF